MELSSQTQDALAVSNVRGSALTVEANADEKQFYVSEDDSKQSTRCQRFNPSSGCK